MKKNRLYFGMLILMLVAVIIWAFYNMLNVGKQETSYRVSVVVENSNSDRWTSLRQGLEQAARDYNISLSFVSTGSFSTAMEEMDVVKKQVTNGANGIILQMNTDHAGQELEDLSGQTAVLLLETDVDPGRGLRDWWRRIMRRWEQRSHRRCSPISGMTLPASAWEFLRAARASAPCSSVIRGYRRDCARAVQSSSGAWKERRRASRTRSIR